MKPFIKKNVRQYMNDKQEKIKHLEKKRDWLLDAFNMCHETMKDYYYKQVKIYNLLIADLK